MKLQKLSVTCVVCEEGTYLLHGAVSFWRS